MSELSRDPRLRKWIRERRQALALTQKELADKVGLSEHTVSSIERGERQVGKNLKAFLEALEATPEEIKQFTATTARVASVSEGTINGSDEAEAQTAAGSEPSDREFVDKGESKREPSTDTAKATSQSSRRAIELGVVFLLGLLGGAALPFLWSRSEQPHIAALVPAVVQPLFWQRCQNQPENVAFIWNAGGSADSSCVFNEQAIVITAGMDTILDEEGIRPRTAPLLLHRLSGNFSVRVKMDFDGGSDCCRHAGLGIRPPGDEQTWLRISKDSQSYHILSQGIVNGKTKRAQIPGDSLPVVRERITYFELVRQGTSVAVRYSLDGKTWIPYYEYSDVPLPEDVEVFLVVHAASSTPKLTAQFSEFTVTPLP
jgi:transcriptional regulator with XRE-family HTH domain/regulation of enolase protein 1 (concanavalin A-like superfamily)